MLKMCFIMQNLTIKCIGSKIDHGNCISGFCNNREKEVNLNIFVYKLYNFLNFNFVFSLWDSSLKFCIGWIC